MKKIMFVCMASLIVGLAHAQKLKDTDVPKVVKDSFVNRFPNAKEVKWSKESATEFEAEFEVDEAEQSVNFDQAGKWLVTETEIKTSQLPAPVQATVAKEFAGYKVEEAEKAEASDSGMFYELEVEKGKLKYEIQISPAGKVLKKTEKKKTGTY